MVDVVMDETPMRAEMYSFSGRILALSIVISVIAADLGYASLQWLLVRPMRRITQSMVRFRDAPENAGTAMVPGRRADEIGVAERELAKMQADLRTALNEKTRLAVLGTVVSKINHDLRNILATAQLMSDRLAASDNPEVRRISLVVVRAVDRAISLCGSTLRYGRAEEAAPERTQFELRDMVLEVGASLGLADAGHVTWCIGVEAGLTINADREQLFRGLLNLGRNAVEAIAVDNGREGGAITVTADRHDGIAVTKSPTTGPVCPQRRAPISIRPYRLGARGRRRARSFHRARPDAHARRRHRTGQERRPGYDLPPRPARRLIHGRLNTCSGIWNFTIRDRDPFMVAAPTARGDAGRGARCPGGLQNDGGFGVQRRGLRDCESKLLD